MTITLKANEGHVLVCQALDPSADTMAECWSVMKVSDITNWREVPQTEYQTYLSSWRDLHPATEETEEGGES